MATILAFPSVRSAPTTDSTLSLSLTISSEDGDGVILTRELGTRSDEDAFTMSSLLANFLDGLMRDFPEKS